MAKTYLLSKFLNNISVVIFGTETYNKTYESLSPNSQLFGAGRLHCEILKTKVAQYEAVSVPLRVKIHA